MDGNYFETEAVAAEFSNVQAILSVPSPDWPAGAGSDLSAIRRVLFGEARQQAQRFLERKTYIGVIEVLTDVLDNPLHWPIYKETAPPGTCFYAVLPSQGKPHPDSPRATNLDVAVCVLAWLMQDTDDGEMLKQHENLLRSRLEQALIEFYDDDTILIW